MPALASLSAAVQDGEILDFERLRAEAEAAVNADERTQAVLAEDVFGCAQATLSRAVNTAGKRYVKLQQRIIRELTPYVIEDERRFVVKRKP